MAAQHYLARLFGNSPARPVQEHMDAVLQCAEQLQTFLRTALAGDWEAAHDEHQAVVALENRADDLKRDLRMHLSRSAFMPVSRADLLDLISAQDRVANAAKDIAGLVIGRHMGFPEAVAEGMLDFAEASVRTTRQAHKAVHKLGELFESRFSGAETEIIREMIGELDELENETDRMQVELRAQLFAVERDLHPVDVMFMYKVIDWVGDVADWSQRIGNRLHLLLAR